MYNGSPNLACSPSVVPTTTQEVSGGTTVSSGAAGTVTRGPLRGPRGHPTSLPSAHSKLNFPPWRSQTVRTPYITAMNTPARSHATGTETAFA